MKIAILTEIINRKSGARAPLEIAKALKALKNEVAVFGYGFSLEQEALEELQKAGVKIIIIRRNKLLAPLSLYKELKRGEFDIISFHGMLPFFLAAKASRIPVVRTYYGTQLDPLLDKVFPGEPDLFLRLANRLVNSLIILKEKFFLANSNQVLAISQYTQKELKKLYGVSSQLVYLGAAPASFKKTSQRVKKEISILSVSRIVPYKGFHQLIKAFKQLKQKYPDIKLIIIGSSPNKKYLVYLKKMTGKNIRIKTSVSDSQLIKAYQQADIYASFDRYMFFGMPILEAATFGLPSVAIARCAAVETIIQSKTGFLAKNEAEFSCFLEKLIKNEKLRIKLGKEAYRNSKLFSWQLLAKKYHQIFEKTKKERGLKTSWLLAGIILLGTILRLAFINKHAFWFDEAWSFFVASQPFPSFFKAIAVETTPPLYFLILKGWLTISQEVVFLRGLSLVFGVLSIPLSYFLFVKLTNSKAALLATTFLALSPLHIYYSVETRMYSLLVFESVLLFWLYLKFIQMRKSSFLFLLGLLGVLGLYTHYYFGLVLLSVNFAFFWQLKKLKRLLKPWVVSQAIILLTFAPWFLRILKNSKTGCWCFSPLIGLPAMFASFTINGMGVVTLKNYVFGGPRPTLVVFSFLSVLAFSTFLKEVCSLRKRVKQNLILLILFLVPILVTSLVGLFLPIFSPRALMIVSPFYYLLVAMGILASKRLKNWGLCGILGLWVISLGVIFSHPFYYGPPLKKAANRVEPQSQEKEVILHTSPMTFYSFLYFHQNSHPEFLITDPSKVPSIFKIGDYLAKTEEIIQKYDKIWVVNTRDWVPPEEIKKIKGSLEPNFVLDQEFSYNDIQLSHYARE